MQLEPSFVPGEATDPALLRMSRINKRFPGVVALDDVSFDVHAGEVHCLIGENGAGKSTLMNIMSGTYTEFDGEMLLSGQPVAFHNTRDAQSSGIAMIHQELNLVPELTVYENIFLGREHKTRVGTLNRRAMRKAAQELMTRLGLAIDTDRQIGQLRVGQRQLVEIAKALSLNARIIIMDEPTSALSDTEVTTCSASFAGCGNTTSRLFTSRIGWMKSSQLPTASQCYATADWSQPCSSAMSIVGGSSA